MTTAAWRWTAAPTQSLLGCVLLIVGVAAAMTLRLAVAGGPRSPSVTAGIVFAAALFALAAAGGWRASLPTGRGLIAGAFGAAVLCAGPLASRGGGLIAGGVAPLNLFWSWALVVSAVAVAEEVVLRGVVFDLLTASRGQAFAVVATAAAFALLHVPLYGWGSIPLDLAVGLWLGGLRLATGGITAPATAHVVADIAAWWLR